MQWDMLRKKSTKSELGQEMCRKLQCFMKENHLSLELLFPLNYMTETIGDAPEVLVIGEVNTGKSSVINSLIGEKKCQTDDAPCTDSIKRIPAMVQQKSITFIDTPGCNSVFGSHEEEIRNAMICADLIIAVFYAGNPFERYMWKLLEDVSKKWHKKVIFLLQKKDLIQEEELINIRNHIKDYALFCGFSNPTFFAVSVEKEQEGEGELSGLEEVRSYLQQNLLTESAGETLVEDRMRTIDLIWDKVGEELQKGVEKQERLRKETEELERKANSILCEMKENNQMLVTRFGQDYTDVADEAGISLHEALSVSTSIMDFGKKEGIQKRMCSVETRLAEREMKLREEFVADVSDEGERARKRVANLYGEAAKCFLQEQSETFAGEMGANTAAHETGLRKLKNQYGTMAAENGLLKELTEQLFVKCGKKFRRMTREKVVRYVLPIILIMGTLGIWKLFDSNAAEKVEAEPNEIQHLLDGIASISQVEMALKVIFGCLAVIGIALAILVIFFYVRGVKKKAEKRLKSRVEDTTQEVENYFIRHKDELGKAFGEQLEEIERDISEFYGNETRKLAGLMNEKVSLEVKLQPNAEEVYEAMLREWRN